MNSYYFLSVIFLQLALEVVCIEQNVRFIPASAPPPTRILKPFQNSDSNRCAHYPYSDPYPFTNYQYQPNPFMAPLNPISNIRSEIGMPFNYIENIPQPMYMHQQLPFFGNRNYFYPHEPQAHPQFRSENKDPDSGNVSQPPILFSINSTSQSLVPNETIQLILHNFTVNDTAKEMQLINPTQAKLPNSTFPVNYTSREKDQKANTLITDVNSLPPPVKDFIDMIPEILSMPESQQYSTESSILSRFGQLHKYPKNSLLHKKNVFSR